MFSLITIYSSSRCFSLMLTVVYNFSCQYEARLLQCFLDGSFHGFITPRRVGGGGVKQLVLSVRPSVRPSVRCLSTQKSGYLAIYRVKRLLNATVTLKSRKKCPGVYLIVAKAVPFAVSTALSYLTTEHSAILIRSQLEYDRGRAYTDSGHVFILAISHAHHFP